MSVSTLMQKIKEKENPSVVGLDPILDYIPDFIKERCFNEMGKTPEGACLAITEFNMGLIDALCDVVPAVKPQIAFYEAFGWCGMRAFDETVKYAAKKGLYVIADAKRGDIGSTATAYAKAFLGQCDIDGSKYNAFNADAVTVNAYLGSDGVVPFVKECEKGRMIFVLVKTSNPSSGELQDIEADGIAVYRRMAGLVSEWGKGLKRENGYSEVGAVIGATYPRQLAELREYMDGVFFLVPGYGAQGGSAKDVSGAFDKRGEGAVINSSRGIMCAYKNGSFDGRDYAKAARIEALRMKDELNRCIANK